MNIEMITDEIVKTCASMIKDSKVGAFEKKLTSILETHLRSPREGRPTVAAVFPGKKHKKTGHAVLLRGESERAEVATKKKGQK
jgi:hypothetical protein